MSKALVDMTSVELRMEEIRLRSEARLLMDKADQAFRIRVARDAHSALSEADKGKRAHQLKTASKTTWKADMVNRGLCLNCGCRMDEHKVFSKGKGSPRRCPDNTHSADCSMNREGDICTCRLQYKALMEGAEND